MYRRPRNYVGSISEQFRGAPGSQVVSSSFYLICAERLKDLDFPIAAYPVLHHGSSETPPPYQIVDNGQSREEGLNYVIQLHALQYEAPALFTVRNTTQFSETPRFS
jgi:hypothetical protein